jgi:nitrous oxidase accessory protein
MQAHLTSLFFRHLPWVTPVLFLLFGGLALQHRSDGAMPAFELPGPAGANEFASLREAIAQTPAGGTLVVHGGHYAEGTLLLDKPIRLVGEGMPVMDGAGEAHTLEIRSDDVSVSGFRITGSGRSSLHDYAGIKVTDARNVRITANRVEGNYFGIYCAHVSNVLIEGNQVAGGGQRESVAGNGIHLWKSDSAQVLRNTVQGHRDGIYFEFVTNSKVEDNRSEENVRYGLHFMFSHHDDYRRNSFSRNGSGVAVMYTESVVMEENTFEDNMGTAAYGVLLKEIRDSRIEHNRFVANSVGVKLESCSRNHLVGNSLLHNGRAIDISGSSADNQISGNDFMLNSFDVAAGSDNRTNSFEGNYWDKYEGYDLDKDGFGDVPFHPVSLFTTVVADIPHAILLYRSFGQYLMDRAEKTMPSLTPEHFTDARPRMKPLQP